MFPFDQKHPVGQIGVYKLLILCDFVFVSVSDFVCDCVCLYMFECVSACLCL